MVEVDGETGQVELKRYVAVDDPGPVINPVVAEGQVHGGIVQGIGQALWEGAVYDGRGQLISGTFMDYAMPKARFFPNFETAFTVHALSRQPPRVKGIGGNGNHRLHPRRGERGGGRPETLRREGFGDAPDAGEGVESDAAGEGDA